MRLLSGDAEPHWIAPGAIVWKIAPVAGLQGIVSGDWDLERKRPFRATAKFRAIEAHVLRGVPWLETELFRDAYARRLAAERQIRGCRTLAQLADDHARRFDRLAASLRRDGFRTETPEGRRIALPSFLIGRAGDVFIGNQGNHRLALAQVLGLGRIAGRITCRHPLSIP